MIVILFSDLGGMLIEGVRQLQGIVQLLIGATIAVVVTLLLLRFLADLLKLNPFGRLYQALRRPTDEMIYHMRSSRFYTPLRRSLGFDPSTLMILVSLAILWYVATGVLNNLFFLLLGLGQSLIAFGAGSFFTGAKYLIGTILLAILFFLMALMTVVFVNWIFGFFRRLSYWAMERLAPLLRIFEFGGAFAGWSFIILWLALSFATAAVQGVFF